MTRTIILFCFFAVNFVFSEEAITTFDESFALNLSGSYNMSIFDQEQVQYPYVTQGSGIIGLGFRYKMFSASLSIPVNLDFSSIDLELNIYFEKLFFESHLKRYKNYYADNGIYENTAGLDIINAGIRAGWVHNNQNHSLSSVYDLDRKQNVSSGSFLYGFGAFYTSIYSENNEIRHYNERNHILYFGPMGGYSYTWILPYDIFVNIGIVGETNLGMNTIKNRILFIPQIKPKINFGHHNGTWSINTVIGCNAVFIVWDEQDYDMLDLITMKVMFSKRF
ncbi:hypothetical protein FACS1894200_01600 [Spirochaetia bacterium]|nr:hypothetical protein FACS1894200_01600 [Spirochaetia bacterium]